METNRSSIAKKLGIAATVVSLTAGSLALWDKVKPETVLPDVRGRWTITNTVTESNGSKFDGEVYVYSVGVNEATDRSLSGTGEQTHYQMTNAERRAAPSRFKIDLTGGQNGEHKITANFTIHGNREFTGSFNLVRDEADERHLTGTFEYTAGGTKGTTDVRIN